MKKRLFLALLASATFAVQAEKPVTSADPYAKWDKAIHAFEESDKVAPPPPGAVLFIGASGITRWKTLKEDFPKHQVINRGFGGSQIDDSVHFADRIVIPYKPRLIIFQAGGNDINAGKSPEHVAKDFEAFVTKVRSALPDPRIVYVSQTPSPRRWAQADKQKVLNGLVKKFTEDGKNMGFLDCWDAFLGPDGKPNEALFVEDRLHNNAEGYKIRIKLVTPCLEEKK